MAASTYAPPCRSITSHPAYYFGSRLCFVTLSALNFDARPESAIVLTLFGSYYGPCLRCALDKA
eukprot:6185252-Pleurochrysis_carterae.AAC.2